MRRALVLSLVSVGAAAVLFFAGAPAPAHADIFEDIAGALQGLPGGITDSLRDSLKNDVLPAAWAQIVPDLPGVLFRGFLLLLGGFGRWWMDGLSPIVQADVVQNSLLVQTPLLMTAQQSDVQEMTQAIKVISLLLLAPAVAWSALLVYAGLQDVQSVIRNSLVGLVGILTIDRLYAGALQIVNALCLAVLGGARGLPGWETMHTTSVAATAPTASQQAMMDGAAVLVYATAAGLSAVGSILHLVAVVIFFACGPLACVFSVVPFLRPAANAMVVGFVTAALVKLPGVIALRLGGAMVSSAIGAGGASSGAPGSDASIMWPLLLGIAVALAYSTILARALFFGSGNVLSQGKTVVRTVTTATGGAPDLRRRLADRDAARRERKEPAASGGSLPTPQMLTHSHAHGHLIGRGTGADAAPVPAPAPARPTPATSGATRST